MFLSSIFKYFILPFQNTIFYQPIIDISVVILIISEILYI